MVIINWEDACGLSGWSDKRDFEDLVGMPVRSVGFLLRKDKKYVTIVQTQSLDSGMAAGLCIPSGWVKSVKPVK